MRELVFATNNAHKIEEVAAILKNSIHLLSLADIECHVEVEESAATLQGNAYLKASYIAENYHMDCFADDTGLEIEALGGKPGVHSARYAGEPQNAAANRSLVLKQMEGEKNRRACFKTVIALILDKEVCYFEGRIDGTITTQELGTNGFGYDAIFVPEGYTQTFAELPAEIKNRISHRANAVKRLTDFLTKK